MADPTLEDVMKEIKNIQNTLNDIHPIKVAIDDIKSNNKVWTTCSRCGGTGTIASTYVEEDVGKVEETITCYECNGTAKIKWGEMGT